MKLKLILSTVILAVLSSSVFAEEVLTFAQSIPGDGNVFENRITHEALQKMPSWNAEMQAPPIDPQKALKIAREHLKKKKKEYEKAIVNEIKMEQFVAPKYLKDKWYYVITFMKKPPQGAMAPDATSVFVMMDGTVNEPVHVKFDPKLKFR
jgi:hypothetical protein